MRSCWIVMGALCALWLCLSATACKCEEEAAEKPAGEAAPRVESTLDKLPGASRVDLSALIPADVDAVVMSDRPAALWTWLQGRDWFQGVRASPVWADMLFSDALYRLSTARHRLAGMSPVKLEKLDLSEVLATPAGLATRNLGEGQAVLLVKQIDLKIQALDRLAELFNQIEAGRFAEIEDDGLKFRQVDLGQGSELFYAVFSNLLLVSNDRKMLLDSLHLSAGKAGESLAADEEAKKLLAARKADDLVILLQPDGSGDWLETALPMKLLALTWSTGGSPKLAIAGALAGEQPAGGALVEAAAVARVLPADSRLVLGRSGLPLAEIWRALVKTGQPEKDEALAQLEARLLEGLDARAVFVLQGFQLETRPRPEAAVLVQLGKADGIEPLVSDAFESFFGRKPEEEKTESGRKLYRIAGEIQAAFAVVDGWLVMGTTPESVRRVVAAASGQAPSLADGSFAAAMGSQGLFGLAFVDCDRLGADLDAYAKALLKSGQRFSATDVDETLGPFLAAVRKVGKLAGRLERKANQVEGSLVPL
ncbi:MAG: hypothetical protein JXR96_23330 [Deltaproteobacteria bacterium]|nr:hypothetical protein [Deltaproteobacteria bacterium]